MPPYANPPAKARAKRKANGGSAKLHLSHLVTAIESQADKSTRPKTRQHSADHLEHNQNGQPQRYAIERQVKDLSVAERYRIRQALSSPQLNAFKTWLDANVGRVAKGFKQQRSIRALDAEID